MPKRRPHRATGRPRGAKPGNTAARQHGFYSAPARPIANIEDVIADLQEKQAALSDILGQAMTDPDNSANQEMLVKLFAIHAQNATRISRLLRDQRALGGQAADGMESAIAAVLDELGTMWGVKL